MLLDKLETGDGANNVRARRCLRSLFAAARGKRAGRPAGGDWHMRPEAENVTA